MPKSRDPQQYDEEYQALQATLEDYLREQVSLLAESGPAPAAAPEGWFRRHRADVYFVVTLALIGFLWWRTPAPAPSAPATSGATTAPPEAVPPPPPPAAPPVVSVRPDPPPGFDDPDAWWRGYVEGHAAAVADWLVAVSEARGLEPDQVSALQKKNLARWSASVRAASALDANLLANVRTGLFEYVYGRWSRDAAGETGNWGRVDLVVNADEYTSAGLRALAAELGREHWFESFDPQDKQLQTAVIVGWIEGHGP